MSDTSTPACKGRVTGSCARDGENIGAQQPQGSKPIRTGGKNRSIQSIEANDRYWTDEVEDRFFAELAATCNVKASAAAVNFTTATVYAHRKQRPEFAARWQDALDHGYVRLEMKLLEAANDSLEGKPWDKERPIPPLTVEQVLKAIKMHQASVKLGFPARRGNTGLPLPLDAVKEDIERKVRAIIAARREVGEGTDNDA
ncbi:MAG: hypothetical protein ABI668_12785 [Sphingorhabdus sp.]